MNKYSKINYLIVFLVVSIMIFLSCFNISCNSYFSEKSKHLPPDISVARYMICGNQYRSMIFTYYTNKYEIIRSEDDSIPDNLVMHGYCEPGSIYTNDMINEDKNVFAVTVYDRLEEKYIIRKYNR